MSVRITAHRGDSESARENTLEAVLAAVDAGAEAVEVDIRTSADGHSVLLHDPTTLRMWGSPRTVGVQTLAELEALGSVGTRIPRLLRVVEALAAGQNPPTLLVDTVDPVDAEVAWRDLSAHPAVTSGVLPVAWCGRHDAMARIRELDPGADLYHNHLGGPLDLGVLKRLRPRVVNLEWTLLTRDLVDQVHALGLECATWTVNDAEQLSLVLDLGVDAVTTDRPRTCRRLLDHGISPLALAWTSPTDLADRAGVSPDMARWVHVARRLGEWTIQFTRTAALGAIEDKANPADVVTEVDKAVERHFRAVLGSEFPDHLIVGEEYGGRSEPGRPTWYIDPVDGTTNLANNLPWTSMSLALAVDDQPLVAVTIQPWTGELFLAARGLGAVRNGVPLQVRRVDSLAGKALLVETDSTGTWPGLFELVEGLADQHCATRVMGSGTLTMTRVADNGGVGGLVRRFSAIDHLAGALIAAEAGARVVNSDGGDSLFPAEGGLLVAPPGAAEKLWPLWQAATAAGGRPA